MVKKNKNWGSYIIEDVLQLTTPLLRRRTNIIFKLLGQYLIVVSFLFQLASVNFYYLAIWVLGISIILGCTGYYISLYSFWVFALSNYIQNLPSLIQLNAELETNKRILMSFWQTHRIFRIVSICSYLVLFLGLSCFFRIFSEEYYLLKAIEAKGYIWGSTPVRGYQMFPPPLQHMEFLLYSGVFFLFLGLLSFSLIYLYIIYYKDIISKNKFFTLCYCSLKGLSLLWIVVPLCVHIAATCPAFDPSFLTNLWNIYSPFGYGCGFPDLPTFIRYTLLLKFSEFKPEFVVCRNRHMVISSQLRKYVFINKEKISKEFTLKECEVLGVLGEKGYPLSGL